MNISFNNFNINIKGTIKKHMDYSQQLLEIEIFAEVFHSSSDGGNSIKIH